MEVMTLSNPYQLTHYAFDGSNVYYSDNDGDISYVALFGGTPTFLAYGWAEKLLTDGVRLYWENIDSVGYCTVDDCGSTSATYLGNWSYLLGSNSTDVFVEDNALLAKCALAGCNDTPTTILNEAGANGIGVDANNIYYLTAAQAVARVPSSGGAPTTVIPVTSAPFNMVFDDTYAYWVDGTTIYKALK